MSGVFGVFDARSRSVTATAEAIAERLHHLSTQQVQFEASPSACEALGRVDAGVYNAAPQPVWNEACSLAVVFAGRLIRDGVEDGDPARSDAHYLLSLYAREGVAMCARLRGSFALALYDAIRRWVIVVADRMGTFPIYYAHREGRFLFAPNQHPLLCDPFIPAAIDLTALAQYMRFQQLLHDTSFFEAIKLLRGGHYLLYDIAHDHLTEACYWAFDPERPMRSDLSFAEAADETARLVVQAVDRCSRGPHRVGIFLSGGLDSRIIVAALGQLGHRPPALTFGSPTSRDVYYAALVAEQTGLDHHLCPRTDGHWVKEYWRSHLMLTDGSHSWIHMHGIYALAEARERMDVNLSGFAGDGPLSGTCIRDVYLAAHDEMSYAAAIFDGLRTIENWPAMSETDEQLLFTPELFQTVKGRAFASLREAIAPFLRYPEPLRTELFFEYVSDIRHYSHYLSFKRAAVEVGLPFIDPDLWDFVFYLPGDYRKDRRLSRAVLSRLSPSLARVPYDHDELLPTDNRLLRSAHHFSARIRRRAQRLLGVQTQSRATLHSDYENWLRAELREWAESILFDRRTQERGLFEPAFLRSLWQRHLAGGDPSTLGTVAPIMSYELMLREFVDS